LLSEISNEPNAEPDLKIFVEPKEGSAIAVNSGLRGYVSAGEAEAYKKELDALRAQTADQIRTAQSQSTSRSTFPFHLRDQTPIRLPARRKDGAGAIFRLRHLSRRHFYLHQVWRERKACAL